MTQHFRDKRDGLFDGEAKFREILTASPADAPDRLRPLEVLFRAFRAVESALENDRLFSKPRHEVISNTPALHKRELAKTAALAEAFAAALRARDIPGVRATLAAQVGMAAFVHALFSWLDESGPGLGNVSISPSAS